MSPQLRGYAIGIAGFIYGALGYGLSIFTYILGATIRPLFLPPIRRVALRPPVGSDTTVVAREPDLRRGRRAKEWSSRYSRLQGRGSDLSASIHGRLVTDEPRLRHATSLDPFCSENSLVLVAPVITVNHVDRIDNTSINAPTITLYPSASNDSGKKQFSKRRSATISHQLLPPRPLSSEDLPVGAMPTLLNLETSYDDNSGIHRSASSPQLASLSGKKLSIFESNRKEKRLGSLPRKGGKRITRDDADSVTSPSPPLRFFSSFPNMTKKRSHTLRTQPYSEPYCVPLPVSPDSLGRSELENKFKRSRTLPPEEIGYPSPLGHRV